MSEYKVLRLQRIRRNEAKLASLGLLAPMTSAASLSSDCSNSKKRLAPQDDVERRVQPTRNAKKRHLTGILTTMSSSRELDPSILLTRERRTLSARECMRTRWSTAQAEATMRRSTMRMRTSWRAVSLTHTFCRCLCFQQLILNPSTPANADRLHLDVCQYQSVEFYKAKKRLIDRYEEVSGGIKADSSPDPLPLPQEMKKQKKKYEGWFAGHYPSPL
jgi:hypothetical protein